MGCDRTSPRIFSERRLDSKIRETHKAMMSQKDKNRAIDARRKEHATMTLLLNFKY